MPDKKTQSRIISRIFADIRQQFSDYRSIIVISLLVSVGGIAVTTFLHYDTGLSLMNLTRDPAATFNFHPFAGFLSIFGLGIWFASATICFFTWSLIFRRPNYNNHYLLVMGALSLFLWCDDAFMLHEYILPLSFHIPQEAVYLGYLILILFIFLYYSRKILATPYLLLGTALFFFGISVILDNVFPMTNSITFYEDLSKFTGIVFWFGYFSQICYSQFK
jgi:hypothetical protein